MIEVESIIARMSPGQSRLSADRVDAMMRQFFQRVKRNLHVIVCLRISRKSVLYSYLLNVYLHRVFF